MQRLLASKKTVGLRGGAQASFQFQSSRGDLVGFGQRGGGVGKGVDFKGSGRAK